MHKRHSLIHGRLQDPVNFKCAVCVDSYADQECWEFTLGICVICFDTWLM